MLTRFRIESEISLNGTLLLFSIIIMYDFLLILPYKKNERHYFFGFLFAFNIVASILENLLGMQI